MRRRRISFSDSMILRKINRYIDSRIRRIIDIANGKPDYYPGGRWPEGYNPQAVSEGPNDRVYREMTHTLPNSVLTQVKRVSDDIYRLLGEIRAFKNMDQKNIFNLLSNVRPVFDYIDRAIGGTSNLPEQLSPAKRMRQINDFITQLKETFIDFKRENFFDESRNFLSLADRQSGKRIINAINDKLTFLSTMLSRVIH